MLPAVYRAPASYRGRLFQVRAAETHVSGLPTEAPPSPVLCPPPFKASQVASLHGNHHTRNKGKSEEVSQTILMGSMKTREQEQIQIGAEPSKPGPAWLHSPLPACPPE